MNKKLLVLCALLLTGSMNAMELAGGEREPLKKSVWEGRLRPRKGVVLGQERQEVSVPKRAKVVVSCASPVEIARQSTGEEVDDGNVSPCSHDDMDFSDQQPVSLDHALVHFETIKKNVAAARCDNGTVDLESIEKAINDCIALLGGLIRNRVCFGLDAEVENHEQCKEEHENLLNQLRVLKDIRKDVWAGQAVGQNLIPALQRQIFDIQLILTGALGRAYTARDVEVKIEELERQVVPDRQLPKEQQHPLTPLREQFLSILKHVVEVGEAERTGAACHVNVLDLCRKLAALSEQIAAMRDEHETADTIMMADQVDVLTELLAKRFPGGRISDLMIERGMIFVWKVMVPLTMKLSQMCERKALPYMLATDPEQKARGRRYTFFNDCCCGLSVAMTIGVLAVVALGYYVIPDASLTSFLPLLLT